jgi:hypothetical protein
MTNDSRQHDTHDWTGEPDKVAAVALAITLVIGAIGFLIIGALALH